MDKSYPEWLKENRICQRCHKRLAADDPGDAGYEWDYDVLCFSCAGELDLEEEREDVE